MIGTCRSPEKTALLRKQGAEPVVLDAVDARAVREAVGRVEPEAIIHQATALADIRFGRNFDRTFAQTNRLRTEGTDSLLAAAREAGVRRFVAQSFASMRNAREGSMVKTEDDPLDPDPPAKMREAHAAMRHLEQAVTGADGIVLRYGGFYGAANDAMVGPVRKRQFPIVGDGGGRQPFIQLDDAVSATLAAIERGSGTYNVVDDDPARSREWIPGLAEVLGTKLPRRVPVWLARLAAGPDAVRVMTSQRGASNARIRDELGWEPRYPDWRAGFATLSPRATAAAS